MMVERRPRPAPARTGMTLLETAVLVSVVGVVLAALVPTFLREVRLSKVSEASENLAAMHRAAAAYFSAHHKLDSGRREAQCVPEPAGPAPEEPSVEPVDPDFGAETTPGHATWSAIGFAPTRGVRFRYSLLTDAVGCGPRREGEDVVKLRFVAEGDLDGDGVLSRFQRTASNREDPDELTAVGPLEIEARVE